MSQFALTSAERIEALIRLGYSPREAAFLVPAALHSGFFLRRQYCRFIGKEVGGTAAALVERLHANRHARAIEGCHNTKVYHLDARPFYAALGQEDNRNRRLRPPVVIKNKLMALDVVLDFPQGRYLATEQEKVEHFTRTLGIPIETLPSKEFCSPTALDATARYFVDKYPISILENGFVTCYFVDEGAATCGRFESYLKQYSRLWARLGRFALVYTSASNSLFAPAQRAFDRFGSADHGGAERIDIERLLTHFEDRRCYEAGSLQAFDRVRLIRMRNDRQVFGGRAYDVLFDAWRAGGERAIREATACRKPTTEISRGTFRTHLLTHTYDIFGSTSRSHDAA